MFGFICEYCNSDCDTMYKVNLIYISGYCINENTRCILAGVASCTMWKCEYFIDLY